MSETLARALAAPAPAAQPMGQQDMLARILMGNPDPSLLGYPVMQSAEGRGFAPMPTSMSDVGARMGAVLRGQVEPTPGERYGMDVPLGWVAGSGGSARDGIRAYHGSPHQFDRFDMSRIGTGEGAQAYGHGLYFAGNEGVADSYARSLGAFHKGAGQAPDIANSVLKAKGGDYDRAANMFRAEIAAKANTASPQELSELKAALYLLENKTDNLGHRYEVRLNTTPDRLLDWDAPLRGQSPAVREAIAPIANTAEPYFGANTRAYPEPTGQNLHEFLKLTGYGQPEITSMLQRTGIPGIQYLDAGSRAAGDGTRNYVMFDDNLIDILRRYGLAGMLTGGAASQAQAGEPAP